MKRRYATHFYCEYWNNQENKMIYEKVYNGNLDEQIKILRIFEENMIKRNEEVSKNKNSPCDPYCCDPLCLIGHRNG